MVIVQSLWVGSDLSLLEIYSIKSFLKTGHEFHLYVYDPIKNIPAGTIVKDANEIMPKSTIFKLKNAYLPFSDIFRYKLLYEKGNYWVDVDLIAMKKFEFDEPFVFSSERTIQKGAYKLKVKFIPSNTVLKAPPKSDFYKELYDISIKHYHKGKNKGKNKDKIVYMRIMRKLLTKYKYEGAICLLCSNAKKLLEIKIIEYGRFPALSKLKEKISNIEKAVIAKNSKNPYTLIPTCKWKPISD